MAKAANKRPGFGTLRGARNPIVSISYIRPLHPKKNTLWIAQHTDKMYWWDGSAWNQIIET